MTRWLVTALIVLAGSSAETAQASQRPGEWRLSFATQQLLEQNRLKRLGRRDPSEAIRRLDDLRVTAPSPLADTAIAEVALRAGMDAPPRGAAGLFLRAAVETYSAALEAADSPQTTELHRLAVEGLITALQHPNAPPFDGTALEITGPLATYELSWLNSAELWTPATYDFIPASHYRGVKTKISAASRPGIGVPVVAWRKGGIPDESTPEGGVFPIYLYSYPLTAILELDDAGDESPRRTRLLLVDPRLHDTHSVGGVDYPLAIDLRAQLAALHQEIDLAFGKGGAIHAGKYLSLTGIYPLEPPRADKIPVVMVHGLASSTRTWGGAFEAISLDPELRRRYQFALFTYPTGLPFQYSATLLRRALVQMIEPLNSGSEESLHQRTVLIGHSMGGLVARLQVTDSGEVLWYAVFSKSPEEVGLSPRDRQFMREVLIFEPLPFVERVIFCSTPHRGAEMASSAAGKLGTSVVKLPEELKEIGDDIVSADPDALTGKAAARRKFPDGVQTLQPDYDVLLALDTLPIDSRVTYHSIIGDRGKGDSPESSDGVVAYPSSSLSGEASEKIVPSGHASHQSEEGIAELIRILHLHLDNE